MPAGSGGAAAPGSGRAFSARGWTLLALAVPPLVVLAVYAKTLGYAFVWDDTVLSQLPVYAEFDIGAVLLGPGNGYEYLPLRDLSLMLDHAVWGERAGGFHATNVGLFALAAVLAQLWYLSLFRASPDERVRTRALGLAFAVTVLLVSHPLQVEPVAFVTARNALLALVFSLSALYVGGIALATRSRIAFVASLAFTLLALLSKATALPLPLLLALEHLYRRREQGLSAALRWIAPHLAVAFGVGALHLALASESGIVREPLSIGGVASRLPLAAFVPQFYLEKTLLPIWMTTEYVLSGLRELQWQLAFGTLVLAGLAGWILVRGSRTRSLAWLACSSYLVALLPVLNLLPSYPPVADRYAQIPLLYLVPLVAVPVLVRLPGTAAVALVALLASVLSLASFRLASAWESSETLFQHAIAVDSRASQSLGNLGMLYFEQGRRPEALEVLAELARVDPDDRRPLLVSGWIALEAGDLARAERDLAAASLKVGPLRHEVWIRLGELRTAERRRDAAIEAYETALEAARSEPGASARIPMIERRLHKLRARRDRALKRNTADPESP